MIILIRSVSKTQEKMVFTIPIGEIYQRDARFRFISLKTRFKTISIHINDNDYHG